MSDATYLPAEARARVEIDCQLIACGWLVQDRSEMNLYAGQGVAVREFIMAPGHGRADYLLFVDGKAVGAVEAKPSGTPLAGVESQTAKYAAGLPAELTAIVSPLPFLYESTGDETMFTDGFDPEPRSRPVVTFHRPETMARWLRQWQDDADGGSLRARLQRLEPVGPDGLRRIQVTAIDAIEGSMVHNKPRALAQMATGSGKTFMAANLAYRLVQTAGAERVLFLVDRANLGRQTLRELREADLTDFVEAYRPNDRTRRVESERFRQFAYDDLVARDKANLDITWLRDESLDDASTLPAPGVLAAEIVEELEAALAQFSELAASLPLDSFEDSA